jgi:hypothetical protein
MKKIDIMNMREGEEWIIVDGKETRIEKKIIIKDSVEKAPIKKLIEEKKKIVKDINKNGK